jgi:hypothetical protein
MILKNAVKNDGYSNAEDRGAKEIEPSRLSAPLEGCAMHFLNDSLV